MALIPSSNSAREASSCTAAGSVVGAPVNFNAGSKMVRRIRSARVNSIPTGNRDPARRICNVERVLGPFENNVDGLMGRFALESGSRKHTGRRHDSNLYK